MGPLSKKVSLVGTLAFKHGKKIPDIATLRAVKLNFLGIYLATELREMALYFGHRLSGL